MITTSSREGKMAGKYINRQSKEDEALDNTRMSNVGSRGRDKILPQSENETNTEADGGYEGEGNNPVEITNLECRVCGHSIHDMNQTHKYDNTPFPDLGEYYITFMLEAMEEWYSKPRDGYHVTDVVMCPRQRIYREIDRRPIDAKTVSIYSAGKAIHEAIQMLFRSNRNRKIY